MKNITYNEIQQEIFDYISMIRKDDECLSLPYLKKNLNGLQVCHFIYKTEEETCVVIAEIMYDLTTHNKVIERRIEGFSSVDINIKHCREAIVSVYNYLDLLLSNEKQLENIELKKDIYFTACGIALNAYKKYADWFINTLK